MNFKKQNKTRKYADFIHEVYVAYWRSFEKI